MAAVALLGCLAVLPNEASAQDELLHELRTVRGVRITGNRTVSTRRIRDVLKTRAPSWTPWAERGTLRLDFLRSDTTAIRVLYRRHGFLEARATYRVDLVEKGNSARVVFKIEEGPRSRIEQVVLERVRPALESTIRKRVWARPGRPFDPAYLHLDTLIVSGIYQNHGFLPGTRARARADTANRVTVVYEVTEGPQYRIGEVHVGGYETVAPHLVTRELLLRPGLIYSATRVRRTQERLYETGLFRQVQVSALFDSGAAVVHFDLRVAERRRRWVDAGVGSGTAERFRLVAEWGARNLFNRGLENALGGRFALYGTGRFQRARLEYTLREPWMFGTRTRGEITPYVEIYDDRANPAFVLQQRFVGLDLRAWREINRYTRVAIVQRNQWVEQDVEPDSLRRTLAVASNYETHRIEIQGERDNRDHPLFPSRGSAVVVSLEVAGGLLSGSSSFQKAEITPAWYTPLGRGAVLATRLRAGVIEPFGRDPDAIVGTADPKVARVPLEDRFRIGGVNSIRGFHENSIPSDGGLAVLEGSIEVRVPVARIPAVGPIGLEAFVDAGNVWTRPQLMRWEQLPPRLSRSPLGPNEVRWVFGLGPRLESPIGPVRMDVSWNLRPVEDARGYLQPAVQFAVGPSF